jgi:hypothetical protein
MNSTNKKSNLLANDKVNYNGLNISYLFLLDFDDLFLF